MPALTAPVTKQTPAHTPSSLSTQSERLWNRAYDELKRSEPTLLDAYERILSRELRNDDSNPDALQSENSIEQANTTKRWLQMEQLAQAGLKKTEGEDKVKQAVGEVLQGVLAVKDITFVNPVTESKANRDGIVHVISRMKWYCELSSLLLKENIVDDRPFAGIRVELEERIVSLYRELLLYLIKSVVSYSRKRIVTILRDTIKLDDWDGSIKSVEDAENAIRQDSDACNTQQIRSYLEKLVDIAKSQEKGLLQNKEDNKCLQHLHLTDPRDDKARIEQTKGGLLHDSYGWILENADFRQWRDDHQSRLLWIKGDPGKGKTMLLCGIVDELKKSAAETGLVSYFFCQGTDSRINNATAVLRGLIYLLVCQQRSLISHVRKKYDHAGKALFENANAWVALCEIFTNILQEPNLKSTYLVIDALDECVADLPKLLDFIVRKSSVPSRVKWIVSSRNDANIERKLRLGDSGTRLSLELKENAEQVSRAVNTYIDHCLSELTDIQHDELLRDSVRKKMQSKANGTFLWVSLVIKELRDVMSWEVLQVLDEIPAELEDVYHRMIKQIEGLQRQYPELCRRVLSIVIAAYRPLHLRELHTLSSLPTHVLNINQTTSTIVQMCGSFLTIRDDNVYIIHQSAKDFLYKEASHNIFPYGIGDVHHSIFLKSLHVMSRTLRRDIYNLCALGYDIKRVKKPDPDPLAASRYSAELQDGGAVHKFMREKYLYWLEALSLCKSMSDGVVSMAKLEGLTQLASASADNTVKIWDVSNGDCLQTLEHSGRVWSVIFSHDSIRLASASDDMTITIWDTNSGERLQTLESHSRRPFYSVVFSHDSTRLASVSGDKTFKIWDANSGKCLQTFEGHNGYVWSVTFSHDSTRLASASEDKTIKIWDVTSGEHLRTLEGLQTAEVRSSWFFYSVAFSHDSTRLASATADKTVKIWDTGSGKCLQILKGHSEWVLSVAFSHNSTRLASASGDNTIKIWDMSSSECLQTLKGHNGYIWSVTFSHDSTRLASGGVDKTIKIWDATNGEPLQTLEGLQTLKGHSRLAHCVTFSHDSTRLASASYDTTVKIWDTNDGQCLRTLKGHNHLVFWVAFSYDSTRLASASKDNTVKIWDVSNGECLQTLKGHSSHVWSVIFSHNSTRLASASNDTTVKIWDAGSGECLRTLEGYRSDEFYSVAFSPDWPQLVSASDDNTVKIRDINSGECLQTFYGHKNSLCSVAFSHDLTRLASASYDHTVKIWDASSGKCLQTLDIGKALFNITFDTTGSYLHTEIGSIAIDALPASNNTTSVTDPQKPQYRGLSLSSDGSWIRYNSENLVWLPSEYRPSSSAVSGKTVVLGTVSGKVWIWNLKVDDC
ncbi:hypothetical protein DL768_009953 [Monosporascus sp. mg162]|nr:hypothetical protein DL768_009953 [Monosporascus sp. mg162]